MDGMGTAGFDVCWHCSGCGQQGKGFLCLHECPEATKTGGNTIGSGWQCPNCQQWVQSGHWHNCLPRCHPDYYTLGLDPLERIAKALEDIEKQLAEHAQRDSGWWPIVVDK
jgi:hypothetical protein